jgi:ATP-dependent RNA helicase DeaD
LLQYERPSAAMIFCRTRMDVDTVGEKLTGRGFNCDTLHGELSQTQRDRVMHRFRTNQSDVLVATDVAARGLDVDHVTHVINYELPPDPEIYVHRIGRTGRAGRSGVAISITTPRERFVLRTIERMTKAAIPLSPLPTLADLRAKQKSHLAQQVLDTIAKEDLSVERALIQGMGEGQNLETIAAAALRIAFGEQLHGSDHDPIINSINLASRSYQPSTAPRVDKPYRPQERDSVRLWIDIGRDKGIRPGDIVGAIANEANIPGRAIGSIELHDGFSYVSVPSRDARRVIDVLNRATIRGHKIKANIVVPKKTN